MLSLYLSFLLFPLGADRAALEAAVKLGLQTGGTAPPGYMTSKGKDPELGSKFGLRELHLFGSKANKGIGACYVHRSICNVNDSDATVAFRVRPSVGTDKTIGYCLSQKWQTISLTRWNSWMHPHRPLLVLSAAQDAREEEAVTLRAFLKRYNVKILNVCGHREGLGNPNWKETIVSFLFYALSDKVVKDS